MKKKTIGIVIITLLTTAFLPMTVVASDDLVWKKIYETNFENADDWETGSFNGPDLWHLTTYDAWSDEESLGCFDENTKHYVNNMNFNYAVGPTLNIEEATDMIMQFYCKFITQDSSDHWGITFYDPGTEHFLAHVWTASETWRHLPYETYGYHPDWIGPMNPMSIYEDFNIKDAYDQWHSLGFFRYGDGSQCYDFRIGFVMYETNETGYTNPEAEANGVYWSGLFIDDVTIKGEYINDAPEIPDTPTGPSSGTIGTEYVFSTESIDPNDDQIKYGWDWDGDGDVDVWSGYYTSGDSMSITHTYDIAGTYYIKVKAKDIYGAESDFSNVKTVVIVENTVPNQPVKPSGPTNGRIGVSYTYSSSSTDSDGDELYYLFDWDDGTDSGWVGPYTSGQLASESHVYDEIGSYSVKVKVRDVNGAESIWSESLSIYMPKNKIKTYQIIYQLFERFPRLANLLNLFI